jgi:tRNA A-37 threonylcarbamoyl transferase component Bud32
MDFQDVKLIKSKEDKVICFSFIQNNTKYFGKLIHLNLQADFVRERNINTYVNNNIKDFKYYTKMLYTYENITIPDSLSILLKDPSINNNVKYNLMIFEYSGNKPLRYYINKVSTKKYKNILKQLREATEMLNDIGVIHYDMYCESNVMLKKEKNEWIIKIIDFGLSYIDLTDKTDSDYKTIIESIEHFNKKHRI